MLARFRQRLLVGHHFPFSPLVAISPQTKVLIFSSSPVFFLSSFFGSLVLKSTLHRCQLACSVAPFYFAVSLKLHSIPGLSDFGTFATIILLPTSLSGSKTMSGAVLVPPFFSTSLPFLAPGRDRCFLLLPLSFNFFGFVLYFLFLPLSWFLRLH